MSEIHIGPHTRDENPHGPGDPHHTYDREIDLKSITKWVVGLIVVTVVAHVLMWWMVKGLRLFDAKNDPELTPIEAQVRQEPPPEPRLQVAPSFEERGPLAASDLEDMQELRAKEDAALAQPSWIDQGQGRLRVPIDVAMQVIASRGAQGVGLGGGAAAGTVTPEQMREQLPAGTSPGAPGATVQMTRPQTPAQPVPVQGEQPAGAAQGQQQPPRPPASQEQ